MPEPRPRRRRRAGPRSRQAARRVLPGNTPECLPHDYARRVYPAVPPGRGVFTLSDGPGGAPPPPCDPHSPPTGGLGGVEGDLPSPAAVPASAPTCPGPACTGSGSHSPAGAALREGAPPAAPG
jgi:hypothetical protein